MFFDPMIIGGMATGMGGMLDQMASFSKNNRELQNGISSLNFELKRIVDEYNKLAKMYNALLEEHSNLVREHDDLINKFYSDLL